MIPTHGRWVIPADSGSDSPLWTMVCDGCSRGFTCKGDTGRFRITVTRMFVGLITTDVISLLDE